MSFQFIFEFNMTIENKQKNNNVSLVLFFKWFLMFITYKHKKTILYDKTINTQKKLAN